MSDIKDDWFYVLETPLGTVYADYRAKTFDEQLKVLHNIDNVIVFLIDKDACFDQQIEINETFKAMDKVSKRRYMGRLLVSAHAGLKDEELFRESFKEWIDNIYGADSEFQAKVWFAPAGIDKGKIKGPIIESTKFPKDWD